ncbi:CRISPR-associated protein Cas5 [Clostridium sp.]|uniref:CRISPR-associated protein Cas5 n=1 Tax=Clostridium sp. TaxID=1506 RepID=UPI0039919A5E
MKKIVIVGDRAHFKIPNSSKNQLTFNIPPISTVVGILQNIFGTTINNFMLGYKIEYKSKEREVLTIYKEVNSNDGVRKLTDSDRFTKDIIYVENLIDVRLVIYTDIENKIEFKEPLVLGKAGYLGKLIIEHNYKLVDKQGTAYNQYTPLDLGSGRIRRINTLTQYNPQKGYYDYWTMLVRESKELTYDKFFDENEGENIVMWQWKDGEASVI